VSGLIPADLCPFLLGEHPDHPGWNEWRLTDSTRYNGAVLGLTLLRFDNEERTRTRIRIFPQPHLTNINNVIHGGVSMALSDIALFAGCTAILGKDIGRGSTLELNTHFTGAGDPERPLDALTELVKETGRLVFGRGTVVQEDAVIASYSGIIRKPSRP
jgi:acyl-coenzyme A thioesterase PaaI-like protein